MPLTHEERFHPGDLVAAVDEAGAIKFVGRIRDIRDQKAVIVIHSASNAVSSSTPAYSYAQQPFVEGERQTVPLTELRHHYDVDLHQTLPGEAAA